MQFNVASMLKEHTGAMREYVIDDDVVVEGERHRVSGRARFDRTPDGIFVRAQISGEQTAQCSRCLKDVRYPVNIGFEEEYIPTIDVDGGGRVDAPEGVEDAYRIDAHHMLDLAEPIAQYWAMSVPIAPLCEDACRGLCPVCGEEIAGSEHRCTREQIDDRWAALKDLKLG
ncbi:MAG: DUF177 domain-containing protein [Dehalococcoidia bacterium]